GGEDGGGGWEGERVPLDDMAAVGEPERIPGQAVQRTVRDDDEPRDLRPEVGDRRLQHRLAELAPELAGVGPTFQQGDEARDPGEQWFGGGKLVGLDALALHDEERGRGLPASDDELEQRGALVGERGGGRSCRNRACVRRDRGIL